MKIGYIKVIRDLASDYRKNLMLILAIALGVFGIGAILGGYSVIKREMADNYLSTVPASATIELEDSLSSHLIDEIERLPGIQVAERHATVSARMKVGDRWHPLLLFVIDDFSAKQTNKFAYMAGAKQPDSGSMLVERTALEVMEAKVGDELMIRTPGGTPRSIKLAGAVHDPGLAPARQQQSGYGYITLSTLRWLGETQGFDQLRLLVSEDQYLRSYISDQATGVANWLTNKGLRVSEIQVPSPGRHPHQSQMNTVMTIFVIFSFMVLILGSILVATSMATLMVRHIRQIGIMKSVGARSFQVAKLYLFMMLLICIAALLVSVPLSRLAAAGFYQQIATLLNLEIRNSSIPVWVLLIQVGAGLLIPLIATIIPVLKGSRISVKQALDHFGVSRQSNLSPWVYRLFSFKSINKTFELSFRNVFRQRKRLLMTLGLLAAGGAMFMTALNVSEAWDENLSRIYTQRLHDLEIRLKNDISVDTVIDKIKQLNGVGHVEGWNHYATSLVNEDSFDITHTYPDKGHGSFSIQAVPLPTQLLNLTVVAGEWLQKEDSTGVVLNQLARGMVPGVRLGDLITLSVDGKPTKWSVVGFTEDVGTPATAYVSQQALRRQVGGLEGVNTLRVAYKDRSKESARAKNRQVEKYLLEEKVPVTGTVPVWLLHSAIAAHMEVMVNALLAMAVLMALVGALGLMSTMSMNVMERTREIGVMRAIGATPAKIRKLIVWEGLIIGVISLFLAFGISLFVSDYFGKFLGNMSFGTPLSLVISVTGLVLWIFLVIVGAYLATLFPAKRAGNITTREALTYD